MLSAPLMKSRTLLSLPALCITLGFLTAPAPADTVPDPATKDQVPPITFVQARIFTQLKFADFTLTGVVRSDKTHKQYPIKLLTKGHEMIYEFQDQPLQIRVQLDPGAFTLEKRTSSTDAWSTITTSDMGKTILDTDIT